MAEIDDAENAKNVFGEYSRVQKGDLVPVRLLHDVAGLPAYRLSVETDTANYEYVRVPINPVLTVELMQISDPSLTNKQSTESHIVLYVKGEKEVLRDMTAGQLLPNVDACTISDWSSTPGTFQIDDNVLSSQDSGVLSDALSAYAAQLKEVSPEFKSLPDYGKEILGRMDSFSKQRNLYNKRTS